MEGGGVKLSGLRFFAILILALGLSHFSKAEMAPSIAQPSTSSPWPPPPPASTIPLNNNSAPQDPPPPKPTKVPDPQPLPRYKPLPKIVSYRAIQEKEKFWRSLFYIRKKLGIRTSAFFHLASATTPEAYGDQLLFLSNLLREADNDHLITVRENESDKVAVEAYRLLHKKIEGLYKKGILPRMEFEQSQARLIKSEWKVLESAGREAEYKVQVDIAKLRLQQARGEKVTLLDLAKTYLNLWDARLSKVKAAEKQAQADNDFYNSVYVTLKTLREKSQAATEEEVIRAQKDEEESRVVLKLAKDLVENNAKFQKEAEETVKKLEALEPSKQTSVL